MVARLLLTFSDLVRMWLLQLKNALAQILMTLMSLLPRSSRRLIMVKHSLLMFAI